MDGWMGLGRLNRASDCECAERLYPRTVRQLEDIRFSDRGGRDDV